MFEGPGGKGFGAYGQKRAESDAKADEQKKKKLLISQRYTRHHAAYRTSL
jgi:hypothetical protein